MINKRLFFALFLSLLCFQSVAEETRIDDNNTELNFYTGMFDFSDDKKNQH